MNFDSQGMHFHNVYHAYSDIIYLHIESYLLLDTSKSAAYLIIQFCGGIYTTNQSSFYIHWFFRYSVLQKKKWSKRSFDSITYGSIFITNWSSFNIIWRYSNFKEGLVECEYRMLRAWVVHWLLIRHLNWGSTF